MALLKESGNYTLFRLQASFYIVDQEFNSNTYNNNIKLPLIKIRNILEDLNNKLQSLISSHHWICFNKFNSNYQDSLKLNTSCSHQSKLEKLL